MEASGEHMSARRTVHVYRSDGAWVIQKEGDDAETFRSQREALTAARQSIQSSSGQIVIHGADGRIREYEIHGMTPVQDPPRKSRLARQIGRAVGRVALKRVKSDRISPSGSQIKK
jgi:hypothetical protein